MSVSYMLVSYINRSVSHISRSFSYISRSVSYILDAYKNRSV